MKKIIFIIFYVLTGFYLLGQTLLTEYEYWFDDNYSAKTNISISPTSTYNLQTAIECEQLEDGLHIFNIRFKDNSGQWSSTVSQYFQKLTIQNYGNILVTEYEYWFDDDYSAKTNISISPTSTYQLQTAIECEQLEDGLHIFNIRFKDNLGHWSSTTSQYFQKITVPQLDNVLVLGEYWFNDNRADVQTIEIDSTDTFIILEAFDVAHLTEITNTIHFRFKDKYGAWSSVNSTNFWRVPNADFTHISGLEEVAFTNTTKYADTYQWDFGDGNTSTQVNPLHEYDEPGAYLVQLIANNMLFRDTVEHYVEIEGVKRISNNRGGNAGFASFDIYGGGLSESTIVKLIKDGYIISTHLLYKKEPGVICATFDLTDKPIGVYDIVVTINGNDYVIINGFTIEEANYPDVSVKLDGNTVFIPGRWQTYTVNYENLCNTDVYGLPINLILSNNLECEFVFDLIDSIGGSVLDIYDSDNYVTLTYLTSELFCENDIITLLGSINDYSEIISLSTIPFDGKMYSVIIPHIPANTNGFFSFRLKIDVSSTTKVFVNTGEILNEIYFNIQEDNVEQNEIFGYKLTETLNIEKEKLSKIIRNEINKSFIEPQTTSKKQLVNLIKLLNSSNCFQNAKKNNNDIISGPNSMCEFFADEIKRLDARLKPNGCGPDWLPIVPNLWFKQACDKHDNGYAICRKSKIETDVEFYWDMCAACELKYSGLAESNLNLRLCLTAAFQYYMSVLYFGYPAYKFAQKDACLLEDYEKNKNQIRCPEPTVMTPQISYDPNEIIGIFGFGDENYIQKKSHLNYTIYFENDAELATAPAQEILLIDTLDLTKFNPEDFSFGTFTFRDITIEAIPNVMEFSKDVDMRELDENIIVRISATFDKATGIIRCHFIAFDPETMDLTESPFLGVLYPNTDPPIGEGNIMYRIGVLPSVTHGDIIENQAHIIFDLNEPIATNIFINTIDTIKPNSSMSYTPAGINDSTYLISWNGTDLGSGIRNYTVYLSENDEEYIIWQYNTTETSDTLFGNMRTSYKFYCIATDNVGNREDPKDFEIEIITGYRLTVNYGTGSGIYDYGDIVEIEATPQPNYHFTQWHDGNTENPRTITITQDMTFTAQFAINTHILTVNNGTGSGIYDYGDIVEIEATPQPNYHFTQWHDGNTENPRTITITQDMTFTAEFAINTHILTVNNGTGSGIYDYGSVVQIEATPQPNYHFTQWHDGNTENPRTITITQDTVFTAEFIINTHILTVNFGTGSGIYDYGSIIEIESTPESNYIFAQWHDGNIENPRSITLIQDTTFTAEFTLSITEIKTEQGTIKIYPNPTKGTLTVEYQNYTDNLQNTIEFYNVIGMLVATYKTMGVKTEIDISHLTQGVYVVKIGNEAIQVVKQ